MFVTSFSEIVYVCTKVSTLLKSAASSKELGEIVLQVHGFAKVGQSMPMFLSLITFINLAAADHS